MINHHSSMNMVKNILLFLLMSVSGFADDLVWDDPNPGGVVRSFTVWKEGDLGVWTAIAEVNEPKWKITLPAGEHRLCVSATGTGESQVSSPLSDPKVLTVLIVPANVRITK
jgi:hypothetical protein